MWYLCMSVTVGVGPPCVWDRVGVLGVNVACQGVRGRAWRMLVLVCEVAGRGRDVTNSLPVCSGPGSYTPQ